MPRMRRLRACRWCWRVCWPPPIPKGGMAIIGESAAGGQGCRRRPAGSGGAQLHSVYSRSAIIDRNGALEVRVPAAHRCAGTVGWRRRRLRRSRAIDSNECRGERMRKLVSDDPGVIGAGPAPAASVRRWQDARLPRLPGRRTAQAFARLDRAPAIIGHRDQRHAARRQGSRPGNLRHAQFSRPMRASRVTRNGQPAGTGAQHRADCREAEPAGGPNAGWQCPDRTRTSPGSRVSPETTIATNMNL